MIHFVLLISRQGKVRLTKWYSPYIQKERLEAYYILDEVLTARLEHKVRSTSNCGTGYTYYQRSCFGFNQRATIALVFRLLSLSRSIVTILREEAISHFPYGKPSKSESTVFYGPYKQIGSLATRVC